MLGATIQSKLSVDDMFWLHTSEDGRKLLRVLGQLKGWSCCR